MDSMPIVASCYHSTVQAMLMHVIPLLQLNPTLFSLCVSRVRMHVCDVASPASSHFCTVLTSKKYTNRNSMRTP